MYVSWGHKKIFFTSVYSRSSHELFSGMTRTFFTTLLFTPLLLLLRSNCNNNGKLSLCFCSCLSHDSITSIEFHSSDNDFHCVNFIEIIETLQFIPLPCLSFLVSQRKIQSILELKLQFYVKRISSFFFSQMVVKNHGNATWTRGLFYNCRCIEAKAGCTLPLCHAYFTLSHIPHSLRQCGVFPSGECVCVCK